MPTLSEPLTKYLLMVLHDIQVTELPLFLAGEADIKVGLTY